MAGIAICTKQSIGVTLSVIVVLYKILFIKNKEDFKTIFKSIGLRILGILLPVIILMIYLLVTGAFSEFLNYAVYGIATFSNKIKYSTLLNSRKMEIKVLSVLVPVSIIVMFFGCIISKIRNKGNAEIQNLSTIFMYSLSIIIVMYPISDEIHFLIGSLITVIGIFYMVSLLAKNLYNKINYKNKYKSYLIISSFIWIVMFSIISINCIDNLYDYCSVEKNQEMQHYKGINVEDYLKDRINDIDEYILKKQEEGKKVYILDSEAVVYMIPIDIYNKDYDMFLKGNIGKDGEKGQIEKIKNRDDKTLYLVRNRNLQLNWQTPLDVVDYIRDNLELVDEISMYEVYN